MVDDAVDHMLLLLFLLLFGGSARIWNRLLSNKCDEKKRGKKKKGMVQHGNSERDCRQ